MNLLGLDYCPDKLCDMQNYSSTYAKLAMFGFAAWGGAAGGGVVAGITMGALVWCIAFSATEMLQVSACTLPAT